MKFLPIIMTKLLLLISATAFISGCTSLQVQDKDSTLKATAKVTGRVLIAIPTLALSEVGFADLRKEQRYDKYIKSFVGKPKKDVVMKFGIPSKEYKAGKDCNIIFYNYSTNNGPILVTDNPAKAVFLSMLFGDGAEKKTLTFYSDDKGKIVDAKSYNMP